ncbi:hypothetical protein M3Y99_01029200 [Aphelenchoides fujianensis]|nr:hypothetical protein M3Y99_01567100 [Aphelenchoides fujianensis]KAI6230681.1 hypothetical protein M3Y99_01029200 [Aphelenchoides fujianensis]
MNVGIDGNNNDCRRSTRSRRPTGPHDHLRVTLQQRAGRRAPLRRRCPKFLKHAGLLGLLLAFQLIGALVFWWAEQPHEQRVEAERRHELERNRTALIREVIGSLFNNTEFLFFLGHEQSRTVESRLESRLLEYERQLGVQPVDQPTKWSFVNALLYAQMICTTIGGGFVHLAPATALGRSCTVLYACIGIPLVLLVLDDLGKLLSSLLKIPWFWFKCACRRLFRVCTKQTAAEIRQLDADDKRDLSTHELPVGVAIFVTIAWILLVSAALCWLEEWTFSVAFYFVFLSLTTIGLGDISLFEPHHVLLLFVYIIIGLALVSNCIALIQINLERAYRNKRAAHSSEDDFHELRRRRSSLGVLKAVGSSFAADTERFVQRCAQSKSSQTVLSFPSPTRNSAVGRSVDQSRMRVYPRTISIDDVMKLVDTEEGDILLLGELLSRDESAASGLSEAIRSDFSADSTSNQVVLSRSFDSFGPAQIQQLEPGRLPLLLSSSNSLGVASRLTNCPSTTPVPGDLDLESVEEMEDRLLLSRVALNADPSVHFRSRLSLIAEQQSVIDEEDESSALTSTTGSESVRPAESSMRGGKNRSERAGRRNSGALIAVLSTTTPGGWRAR